MTQKTISRLTDLQNISFSYLVGQNNFGYKIPFFKKNYPTGLRHFLPTLMVNHMGLVSFWSVYHWICTTSGQGCQTGRSLMDLCTVIPKSKMCEIISAILLCNELMGSNHQNTNFVLPIFFLEFVLAVKHFFLSLLVEKKS